MVKWQIIATTMELKHVKSAKDLKVLGEMDWHDSEAVTGLITRFHQDEFPMTINYSRNDYPNVHLPCKIYSGPAQYLELVFVAVQKMNIGYLNNIFISGRVNGLSNVIGFIRYIGILHLYFGRRQTIPMTTR